MELLEGIETRKSSRAFEFTPIPREIMERILTSAGNSPSYSNSQPWEIAVVSGKKRKELGNILYDVAKSGVTPNHDLPSPKIWPPELDRRAKEHYAKRSVVLGIEPDDKQRKEELNLLNLDFYRAPYVLFLFIDSTLTPWSIFDMGIFTQNIILAAHSLGLGSCIQASAACYPDAIRAFLGIPKTKLLLVAIALGYPNLEARIDAYRSTKKSLNDFVSWYP